MLFLWYTRNTASLVASAIISAQDTTPGHALSSLAFASSIISNPLTVWFGTAAFSDTLLPTVSIRIDASQPFNNIYQFHAWAKPINLYTLDLNERTVSLPLQNSHENACEEEQQERICL